jgi:hypothetical protein
MSVLLTTPEKVLQLYGVGISAPTQANVQPAIMLASARIQAMLETNFNLERRTDYFDILSASKVIKCRLENSHLTTDTVVVRYSVDGYALTSETSGELFGEINFSVDRKQGVVTLYNVPALGREGLSITYTSGFEVNASDTRYLDSPPEWLSDAAAAISTYVLKEMPSTPANKTNVKGQAIANNNKQTLKFSESLVNPYLRPRANLIWPTQSELHSD